MRLTSISFCFIRNIFYFPFTRQKKIFDTITNRLDNYHLEGFHLCENKFLNNFSTKI